MLFALFLTAFAICGAAAGVRLGQTTRFSPRLAAMGAGLLFGISLFWMLPEMVEQSGWALSAGALSTGALSLWAFDHFIHPICPNCSHHHDHAHCNQPPLHGFALPLLLATGVHSIIDGWTIRVLAPDNFTTAAAAIGLALHKVPEGFALGLIARESMKSAAKALLSCAAVECLTLLGAALEPLADHAGVSQFGSSWITGVLALTGGSFLFLGYHTLHGSRGKPGVIPAFMLTLGGVAAIAFARWRFGIS
jgi:zinc transporter ZupT